MRLTVGGAPRARPRSPRRARARRGRRRCPRPPARRAPAPRPASTRPAPGRAGRGRGSPRMPAALIASIAAVGRVRRRELLRRQRQHPGDVERDVPVPDHDRALVGEVELEVLEVRVAVVPGDERGRGPRAGEVLARDPEPAIGLRARRRRRPRRRARASSSCVTSRPTSTLPKKRKPGRCAIFSNARETALMFGWSGATPSRTSPTASAAARSCRPRRGSSARAAPGGVEPGRPGADDGDAERAVAHARPNLGTSRAKPPRDRSRRNRSRSRPPCVPSGAPRPPRPGTSGRSRTEETAFGLSILNPDSWRPFR